MPAFHLVENVFTGKTIHGECLRLCRPSVYSGSRHTATEEDFRATLDLYF